MSTKAEILKRLEDVADDQIIAVPVIRTKEIAEDLWEYSEDEEITLTQEQWAEVVKNFEDAEFYDDEALVETIRQVVEKEA